VPYERTTTYGRREKQLQPAVLELPQLRAERPVAALPSGY
jgi:hypothetical protein